MSAIFLKRFLKSPFQVASIIPSSRNLVRQVASRIDFNLPLVIAEFGAGEGRLSREIVRRMAPGSRLFLFELDPVLANHLTKHFAGHPGVTVLNADAATARATLRRFGIERCDYVISGIPFSIIPPAKKRKLIWNTHALLLPQPHAAFITYQVTNELRDRGHCQCFARAESEYCLRNFPPMFVTAFYKTADANDESRRSKMKTPNRTPMR